MLSGILRKYVHRLQETNRPSSQHVTCSPVHNHAGINNLLRYACVDAREAVESGGAEPLIRWLQSGFGNAAVQRMFESEGDPIGNHARRPLERRLANDLTPARIHNDAVADSLTGAMGARAVTVGQHIFFRSGEYDPTSDGGVRLIAHEAAHVVQQQGAAGELSLAVSERHESAAASFAAGAELSAVAAPAPAVQRQADDGSQQSTEVPVHLSRLTVQGDPTEVDVEGGCDGLSLHGQANATYNGGRAQVAGQKVSTSGACGDCGEQQCLHLTGTLVTNYAVSVAITMPPMPGGLTPCEQGKVRTFLRNVLLPHEKDHESRFKTYNGQTKNPVDITGCGRDDLQAQITNLVTNEDAQRQANANALSAAIDPFVATIDCTDCDSGG